jgi:UDP-GlcNAc3NAcA epimerase
MKILTVIGARPQFIKAAVVSQALHAEGISEFLVHTGQHFDENMSLLTNNSTLSPYHSLVRVL